MDTWGALLAVNLSARLQELAGLDGGDGRGQAHLGTLRHRLLTVPARLVHLAGQVTLRLPQADICWPRSWPDSAGYPSGLDPPGPTGPDPARGDQRIRRRPGHRHTHPPRHHTIHRQSVMYSDHVTAIRGSGSEGCPTSSGRVAPGDRRGSTPYRANSRTASWRWLHPPPVPQVMHRPSLIKIGWRSMAVCAAARRSRTAHA